MTQSFEEAERYYRLAADQGHAKSQHYLGVMHYNGEGVTQSFEEAARYYRLAADQGHAEAQKNVSLAEAGRLKRP